MDRLRLVNLLVINWGEPAHIKTPMAPIICIHEYVLKPDIDDRQFEQAELTAQQRRLFDLRAYPPRVLLRFIIIELYGI